MMSERIVDTEVKGTAAAHYDHKLPDGTIWPVTVIWSLSERRCDPTDLTGKHITVKWGPTDTPQLWDLTGKAQWRVNGVRRCPYDGRILVPRHYIMDGHVSGESLRMLARMVAKWSKGDDDDDRIAVQMWLEWKIAETLAAIRGGKLDLADLVPVDRLPPGEVGVGHKGELVAWAHDPAGKRPIMASANILP